VRQQAPTEKRAIAAAITAYVEKNGLRIHPGQEAEKWAELVIEKGGCPCVPGRDHCPCEEALEDIKKINRCRCGLFCNDTYLEEYERLKDEARGKKRWSRKPRVSSSRR